MGVIVHVGHLGPACARQSEGRREPDGGDGDDGDNDRTAAAAAASAAVESGEDGEDGDGDEEASSRTPWPLAIWDHATPARLGFGISDLGHT